MPMYVYNYTFQAANDSDAALVAADAGDAAGARVEGSSAGITGVHEFGGSVVRVTNTDYWQQG